MKNTALTIGISNERPVFTHIDYKPVPVTILILVPFVSGSLLPSDFILLARSPQSQFFGHFDVVKNKNMKIGTDASSLPPLGGVVSDYVLQRNSVQENKVGSVSFLHENKPIFQWRRPFFCFFSS